jgi:ribosomal protein S18 acetylase RimI-like enzyme
MEIRQYIESDEQQVSALWREVFPNNPWWNVPELDIRRKLKVQRELFLVALIDEVIVGTAMAGYDGHRGWVYYVTVKPEIQRQGIGEALMKRVEQDLILHGCTKLNLRVRATNKQVVAFYKKLGYKVEDMVSMGKLFAKTRNLFSWYFSV